MSKLYSQILDRPVFIMAAPRSGSTLLFETLIKAKALCSIGDESHALIEQFPALKPERRTPPSNMLDADDFDAGLKEEVSRALVSSLVDVNGQSVIGPDDAEIDFSVTRRMIEKTPKNILRIPFFDAVYPDALFIYLYRNPLENISSIMDGWRAGNFVTYAGLRVAAGPWSFLLPPGWESKKNDKLESIAAWQWITSHEFANHAFSTINRKRVFALNYDEFLANTAATVEQLCLFMDINFDAGLAEHCANPLPLSRYTLSQPRQDKWKKNAGQLADVLRETRPIVDKINRYAGAQSTPLGEKWNILSLRELAREQMAESNRDTVTGKVSRNEPCPCGSGKKYKRCHGNLSSAGRAR